MEIQLKGSTNNIKTVKEALSFARAAARICYSKFDFEELVEEDDKSGLIDRTLKYGHHSPFDHVQLTFYLKDIPKFGAMLLNNERPYTTSEKSARYTVMQLDDKQQVLYDKWMKIFIEKISSEYPQLDEMKVKKLAQENARYISSVFTPTKMLYTVSFRQLNYIMHFFDSFISDADDTDFNVRVKEFMKDFNEQMSFLCEKRLVPDIKKRYLSMFAAKKVFKDEFGESFSTTYKMSFAGLAQAHRHRTLRFEILPVSKSDAKFFVPPIIEDMKDEWIADLETVKNDFPQAMLVDVHEFGYYGDFISKMVERMCGHAQWEIMDNTRKVYRKYLDNVKGSNSDVYEILEKYSNGPKCTFPDIVCTEPCPFGPRLGLERKV